MREQTQKISGRRRSRRMAAGAKALGGYVPGTFEEQQGGRFREGGGEVHGTLSG